MEIDIKAGRELRDSGVDSVLSHAGEDWRTRVAKYVTLLPAGETFIAEDIRLACESLGVHASHPNAWGGMFLRLVGSGLIVATGEYRQMKDKRSHARKSQVYKKL